MDPFIQRLQDSVARFSIAVSTGPLDAPVRGCPGWDLAQLTRHLGFVHRWARLAVVTGAPPDTSRIDELAPDAPAAELLAWFMAGADALVESLAELDPEGPTWHPFLVPKLGKVWPRRQAHETFIHAWDAEDAIGAADHIDPVMAADGIAEYFEVMVSRIITRDQRPAPVGSISVVCTDAEFAHGSNRLVVRVDDPFTVVVDSLATPTSELVGRAEDLTLALWGRRSWHATPADDLAAAWLRYGGS